MTVKTVPFFRPSIGSAEIEAVTNCMQSGWLTTGPNARAFEEEFSGILGKGVQSLAVTSATAALHLGLEAMGVGPGDEVIVPTLTFTATAEVVRYLGAKVVLVDIEPATLCIDVAKAEEAITDRTKVIMPVHFAGRPANLTALRLVADRHGLKILDDAAHTMPAVHAGRMIGNCLADATAFSFYANKTMTTGEGGMLCTRDPDIAARSRVMRLHGIDRDVFNRFQPGSRTWAYDVVAPGFKYNMTDMAAALGRVQLSRIEEFLSRRTELAENYRVSFADLPLKLPPLAEEADTHSWHLFILRLQDNAPIGRDEFIARLNEVGIGTSVHYRPLNQMTYWGESLGNDRRFPEADAYFDDCVTIPLFMAMTDEEQDRVISVVREILSS